MKNYIKPFFLALFNNVFLLMIDTPEVNNHLWSLIVFTLLWFITFFNACCRYKIYQVARRR